MDFDSAEGFEAVQTLEWEAFYLSFWSIIEFLSYSTVSIEPYNVAMFNGPITVNRFQSNVIHWMTLQMISTDVVKDTVSQYW